MLIWIDNQSNLSRGEVRDAIGVLNHQIKRDFSPNWGLSAEVRLHKGGPLPVPRDGKVGHIHLHNAGAAVGYHQDEASGIPAGFVIVDIPQATQRTDPWLTWTVALSHECLELIADPHLNIFVRGPHPTIRGRMVYYYREVCDPVQGLVYKVDGASVSNFVLPHYYNAVGQKGRRNDFLDSGLKAFGFLKAGVVGFLDPKKGNGGTFQIYPDGSPKDAAAVVRRLKGTRGRLHRYARPKRHVVKR
jgi:hypothetical protein